MSEYSPGTFLSRFVSSIAVLAVLVLLYFGLLLRDWHYVEDVRAMVVPFVLFGMCAGALLSLIPWFKFRHAILGILFVFFVASVVAILSIVLHVTLIEFVGFCPKPAIANQALTPRFYNAFAAFSVIFFACTAVCGYQAALSAGELLMGKLNPGTLPLKRRHELLVMAITGSAGLLGSVLASLLGAK